MEHGPVEHDHNIPTNGHTHVKTVKKKIHIPVEQTIKVPVMKKEAEIKMERKVVKGQQVVPIKKFKEVEETVVEVQEEVVHGYREVWKKVREPTTEVVKKRVPVVKKRQVPYMDYETKEVEMVVDVPKEEVKTKTGYRYDKHIGSKIVEVEEDHHYEMRPVRVAKGQTRVKEHPDNYEHYGKAMHGAPDWDNASVSTNGHHHPEFKYGPGSQTGMMTARPRSPNMYSTRMPNSARPRSAGSSFSVRSGGSTYGVTRGGLGHTTGQHFRPSNTSYVGAGTRGALVREPII